MRSHMRKIKLYGDGTHDSLVATIYEDGKVESEEVLEVLTKEYGSIIDSAVRNFDDLYETILEDDNLHYVPGFYFAHYETEEE